ILRLVPVLCTACSIDLLSEERTENLAKCIVDVSNAYFTDGDTLLYLSPIKDLSTKGRSVADVLYRKFRHLDLPLEPQETCLSTRKLLSVDKLEDWDTAEYNEYLEHYLLIDYECNFTYESSKTKYVDTEILRSLHEDSKWPIILQPYSDGWYKFSGIVKGYVLTIQKNESLSNIENFCLMFDYSPALSKDSNILVIVLSGWLEEFEYANDKRATLYVTSEVYNQEDTFLQSMSQVFNIPNSALLFSEEIFDYFTQKYCGSGLIEKYHKFTTKSHQEHIFVNVINPLIRSRFSTLMQRLVQGGFPEKIMRDVTDPCGRFAFMTPKVGIDNYVQMSLSHFKSSMIVYVTGIILAGTAFIWEMVIDVRFSTGIRDYHSNAKSLFDARAN
ncbi:hypothetical protein C0J52_09049, partial [Blattella germanica]